MIELNYKANVNVSTEQEGDASQLERQLAARANYLLLDDPDVNTFVVAQRYPKLLKTRLKWLNKGEIIAGSWVANKVFGSDFSANDIDIYFRCKDDAKNWAVLNGLSWNHKHEVAYVVETYNCTLNLIFGIYFKSPEDLISRFDIRACSTAYDPNTQIGYYVAGALEDGKRKCIVYNPLPHNTSIARLLKYIDKGFTISAHQRVFLLELIKGNAVDPDIELTTGYRAVQKV